MLVLIIYCYDFLFVIAVMVIEGQLLCSLDIPEPWQERVDMGPG